MTSYLVTGTSRGIGLELVKQLLDLPATLASKVFAVTRDSPSSALQQLIDRSKGRALNIVIPDTTKEDNVAKGAAESVAGKDLLDTFQVNVVSAHTVTAGFFPLLKRGTGKKVINVSTGLASVALAAQWKAMPTHAYKISKTAMNMLNAQWAADFADEGFTFLAISPGWLQTDMGSQQAHLPVAVGVSAVRDLILKADKSITG